MLWLIGAFCLAFQILIGWKLNSRIGSIRRTILSSRHRIRPRLGKKIHRLNASYPLLCAENHSCSALEFIDKLEKMVVMWTVWMRKIGKSWFSVKKSCLSNCHSREISLSLCMMLSGYNCNNVQALWSRWHQKAKNKKKTTAKRECIPIVWCAGQVMLTSHT